MLGFGWLKNRLEKINRPPASVVTFGADQVTCVRPGGFTESVSWAELRMVEILTTDEGPLQEDVFWLLHGSSGGCAVPQSATGCDTLLERLQKLPGFDNAAVIEAMGCTDNKRFVCWRREPTHRSP